MYFTKPKPTKSTIQRQLPRWLFFEGFEICCRAQQISSVLQLHKDAIYGRNIITCILLANAE